MSLGTPNLSYAATAFITAKLIMIAPVSAVVVD
jgi:hypothetical protein